MLGHHRPGSETPFRNGVSLAGRRWSILTVFGSSIPSSTKKKRYQIWTPSDKLSGSAHVNVHLSVHLANSEDSDEMPQYTAFHQVLHVLLRKNKIFRERNYLEIVTYYPTVFTMNHSKFIVSKRKEESIGA